MAMLVQPAVRTRQPQGGAMLDPRWAARIHACVDAGNMVSYRNGSVGVPYVSLTTPARASGYWTRKVDARGNLASIVSYDQLSTHLPRQAVTVTELTLFATGFIGAASGDTFQVMAAMMDLNGPTYVAYIAFDRTSGKLIAGLFKGGAWTVLDSGITFEYGKTYRCSLTAKSGYAEMYVDGIRVATDTSAGWVSYTTFRDLCVGNSEYNYFRLNGGVLVAGATRSFSPSDAKALSANPWQIFRATEVPTFTVSGGGVSVTPTGVSATGSVGSVTVSGKASTTPTGVSATGSVGTVTVAAKASTTATGSSATGSVGSVTVTVGGAVSVTPTGVSATGSIGTPTVAGDANTTPVGVPATGAIGSVTVTAGSVSVTPTGVSATGAVGTPTVTGKASTTPTGVSATGAVGTVTVLTPSAGMVYVTGVQGTTGLGSVSVLSGRWVQVTGVSATGLVGYPIVWSNIPTPGGAWVEVPTSATPSWTPVATPTNTWTNVLT